jgi:hypothetical protein
MSVVDDAKREMVVARIAMIASCSQETVNRLFNDRSVDELVRFEHELKDGKKAIQYGKIVEL